MGFEFCGQSDQHIFGHCRQVVADHETGDIFLVQVRLGSNHLGVHDLVKFSVRLRDYKISKPDDTEKAEAAKADTEKAEAAKAAEAGKAADAKADENKKPNNKER